MAERPDLRKISGNIREALADFDREALLEILTYVFKEYVVEGPPPMLISQHEKLEDLAGLSFAQLMSTLQTRLEHPELGLFAVEGNTVTVRAGGNRVPLQADTRGRSATQPAASAPASSSATAEGLQFVDTRQGDSGPRASVQEAETRGRGDLAGGERSAPRPVAGLSVSGRRSAGGMMDAREMSEAERRERARREATGSASPQAQAVAPTQGKKEDKPEEPPATGGADDDASIRFSLLELD